MRMKQLLHDAMTITAWASLAMFAAVNAEAQVVVEIPASADGQADRVGAAFTSLNTTSGQIRITRPENAPPDETVGLWEFDVSQIPSDAMITDVKFLVRTEFTQLASRFTIDFTTFAADGVVELADATAPGTLAREGQPVGPGDRTITLTDFSDVEAAAAGGGFLGLRASINTDDTMSNLRWGTRALENANGGLRPTLRITYVPIVTTVVEIPASADGQADRVGAAFTSLNTTSGQIRITRPENAPPDETVGLWEFDVSQIPSDAMITDVKFLVRTEFTQVATRFTIDFTTFAADGVVELADATAPGTLAREGQSVGPGDRTITLTDFSDVEAAACNGFLGLRASINTDDTMFNLRWGTRALENTNGGLRPTLRITYQQVAECEFDFNDDESVDVMDLLDFLNGWYPASSGAACP